MDDSLRRQIDAAIAELDVLIRRGRALRESTEVGPLGDWQRDCAALVSRLSGGSKAHWLARRFSGAFLVRAADGGSPVEVEAGELVDRTLDVLADGRASLAAMDEAPQASRQAAGSGRFEFVRDSQLRPVLEQTFEESRAAFERGDFGRAMVLSCGVLEALLTDALDRARPADRARADGPIAEWPFDERIAAAERRGLIGGGCARLPPVARAYRSLTDASGELRGDVTVTEREARLAGQVLRVVIRDLDPGR